MSGLFENKLRLAIVAVGLVLVIAVAAFAASRITIDEPNVDEENPIPVEQIERNTDIKITLNVSAENWDEKTSTPVIAHFVGETNEFYCELKPNESTEINLAADTYLLNIISPVNKDGSAYSVSPNISANIGEESIVNDLYLGISLDYLQSGAVTEAVLSNIEAQTEAAKSSAKSSPKSTINELSGSTDAAHEHEWVNHPTQYSYINLLEREVEDVNAVIKLDVIAAFDSCYCGAVKAPNKAE